MTKLNIRIIADINAELESKLQLIMRNYACSRSQAVRMAIAFFPVKRKPIEVDTSSTQGSVADQVVREHEEKQFREKLKSQELELVVTQPYPHGLDGVITEKTIEYYQYIENSRELIKINRAGVSVSALKSLIPEQYSPSHADVKLLQQMGLCSYYKPEPVPQTEAIVQTEADSTADVVPVSDTTPVSDIAPSPIISEQNDSTITPVSVESGSVPTPAENI